jgi:PAS domain S-box-containing protein
MAKNGTTTIKNYAQIKQFLLKNILPILSLATDNHIKYLGKENYRNKFIKKYRKSHKEVVENIAEHLEDTDIEKGSKVFEKLGVKIAKESVRIGLTIEEAVNGIIFLKQAIWGKLRHQELLKLSAEDFYQLSKASGIFCDIISSKIAFTYHSEHSKLLNRELEFRKENESKLKLSESRFRVLVEGVKDYAIFMIDMNGKITSWNHGATRILGYRADEVIGKHYAIFRFDKNKMQKSRQEIEVVKKKGQFQEIAQRRRKDGTIIWADVLTTKVYENSHLRGFAKIIRDITNQKYEEENLKYLSEASKVLSSSLDYKTTLETIAQLAVPKVADWCSIDIVNEKGKIKQIALAHKNPRKIKWAKELRKKYPPDKNSKTGLINVIKTGKPEFYPVISDELLKAASKDEEHYKLVKHIGFTSAMIVPLFRKDKCIGAITFVSTETKRNYTRRDLEIAKNLSIRASLALENAQLFKASQDAVNLRDNFISVASHELKTPVTSVKIFAQVLKKHSEQIGDEKAVNYLNKMENQIDKLTELIYDLLNVSRIQAGRIKYRQQKFNFDDFIKEIVEVLQSTETKHVLLLKGGTKAIVNGDKERIGQVINNLVANATKYSPSNDKVIISTKRVDGQVVVSVKDFGIGIQKSHQHKIFERFYRVFDSTDKTFPGLGLGLYIASEIVKRHGGKLWVKSNVGKGSTFYFSLPVIKH